MNPVHCHYDPNCTLLSLGFVLAIAFQTSVGHVSVV